MTYNLCGLNAAIRWKMATAARGLAVIVRARLWQIGDHRQGV
jgi:hypothetical protein